MLDALNGKAKSLSLPDIAEYVQTQVAVQSKERVTTQMPQLITQGEPILLSTNAPAVKVVEVAPKVTFKPPITDFITHEGDAIKTEVVLRFRIAVDVKGTHTVTLMEGSGYPEFDRAFTNYLKAWRWAPATQNGIPTPAQLTQTITLNTR